MAERAGVITRDPRRELRIAGAIIGIGVALIHLFHPRLGAPRLIEYLELGELYHPLPPIFTLSAFLIIVGIFLVHYGVLVRTVYLLGILMMVTFVVGYGAWHTVLSHGSFWPQLEGATHEQGVLELLWLHVRDDLLGVASKVLELLLAAVLAMLYLIDRPTARSHHLEDERTAVPGPEGDGERADPRE